MPRVEFEPTISAGERPQTYALHRAATGTDNKVCLDCTIIQVVSRLVDIIAGGNFLGFCDKKSSYKHVSDFGRLRSYDPLKLGIEGNDY